MLVKGKWNWEGKPVMHGVYGWEPAEVFNKAWEVCFRHSKIQRPHHVFKPCMQWHVTGELMSDPDLLRWMKHKLDIRRASMPKIVWRLMKKTEEKGEMELAEKLLKLHRVFTHRDTDWNIPLDPFKQMAVQSLMLEIDEAKKKRPLLYGNEDAAMKFIPGLRELVERLHVMLGKPQEV